MIKSFDQLSLHEQAWWIHRQQAKKSVWAFYWVIQDILQNPFFCLGANLDFPPNPILISADLCQFSTAMFCIWSHYSVQTMPTMCWRQHEPSSLFLRPQGPAEKYVFESAWIKLQARLKSGAISGGEELGKHWTACPLHNRGAKGQWGHLSVYTSRPTPRKMKQFLPTRTKKGDGWISIFFNCCFNLIFILVWKK